VYKDFIHDSLFHSGYTSMATFVEVSSDCFSIIFSFLGKKWLHICYCLSKQICLKLKSIRPTVLFHYKPSMLKHIGTEKIQEQWTTVVVNQIPLRMYCFFERTILHGNCIDNVMLYNDYYSWYGRSRLNFHHNFGSDTSTLVYTRCGVSRQELFSWSRQDFIHSICVHNMENNVTTKSYLICLWRHEGSSKTMDELYDIVIEEESVVVKSRELVDFNAIFSNSYIECVRIKTVYANYCIIADCICQIFPFRVLSRCNILSSRHCTYPENYFFVKYNNHLSLCNIMGKELKLMDLERIQENEYPVLISKKLNDKIDDIIGVFENYLLIRTEMYIEIYKIY
jgi:hypothetical protein